MQDSIEVVNELLINSFNKIVTVEKYAIKQGPFSDLTIKEQHAIEAIGLHPQTMTEVAKKLEITVGSLTIIANRLCKKEYVLRQYIEDDRRCIQLVLTQKGRLAYRLHGAFHHEMVKMMIESLDDQECQVLVQSLKNISEFFRETYGPFKS